MSSTSSSTASPRVGIGLIPMEIRLDVVEHVATTSEALGFDYFGLAEGWASESFSVLGRLSACTSTIGLSTGVVNVWSRSAAVLAMAATTMQTLSRGRFTLGLGAGTPPLVEGLHDLSWHEPLHKMASVLEQVQALLAGDRIPLSRPDAAPLRLGAASPQRVPVELAGMAPASVRLAGARADGWTPWLWPRSRLDEGRELLAEGAQQTKREDLAAVRPAVPVAIAEDEVGARRIAAQWLNAYLTRMGPLYPRMLRERFGLARSVDAFLAAPDDVRGEALGLVQELMVFGTHATAEAAIDDWLATGVDGLTLVLPAGHSVSQLDEMLAACALAERPRRERQ